MPPSGNDLSAQAAQLKAALPVKRSDGRKPEHPRPARIETGYTTQAEGSVLIVTGETKLICTASIEEKVPPFRRGTGSGWVTAEYGMLPRSTSSRMTREATVGKAGGRTLEIQRLIGRSLRSVVDLEALGECTVWIDCDVIQADGGTRTAAITGGYVALVLALRNKAAQRRFRKPPLTGQVAAISVGMVDGRPLLDLNYEEDSRAEVDLNAVMTGEGELVEIQGTAEGRPFSRDQLNAMLDLAQSGIARQIELQLGALGGKLL